MALRPRTWGFGAAAGILVLAFAQGCGLLCRSLRARDCPPEADWAFHAAGYSLPSGHTATDTVAGGLLCLSLARGLRGAWRFVAMAVLALWAAVDGVGRVYLGLHWPTEVITGWLVAGLLTVLAAGLFARLRASALDPSDRPLDLQPATGQDVLAANRSRSARGDESTEDGPPDRDG